MLPRWIGWITTAVPTGFAMGFAMSVATAVAIPSTVHADVLHFSGTLDTLYDCPDTWPGSACGNPVPQTVSIPFTFTMDITQIVQHLRTDVSHWVAPEFPMPPPITQASFESLSNRNVTELNSVNTYEEAPTVPHLLSYAARTRTWTGIDALGRTHHNTEQISVGFTGDPRTAPGTPITFDELQAMWALFFAQGRTIDVQTYVAHAITPPGSFEPIEASGHFITGRFRLCRAPGAAGLAAAAFASWLRDG
jgi:hypothetical protein